MHKKIIIISSIFLFIGNNSPFAKTNARGIRAAKSKITSSVNTKSASKTETSSTTVKTKTCQEKFNDCMDKVCINDQGIRYNCSSSYDTFDTVTKDGNKIRLGSDLYTYAKGSCISILKSCELQDRNNIENQYKAQIQTDFLSKNYFDVMAYTGEEAKAEALQEYVECMKPLCGENFSDCFSITAVERRAPQCEKVLSKTARPLSVKKAFYDELENINRTLCSQTGGYIDFDKKNCKVEVVIGKPKTFWENGVEYLDDSYEMEAEFARRYFNFGEIVECTQEYFSTFYEENKDWKTGMVKLVSGAAKAVAGVVVTVVGAIATAYSGGAAKGLIGSGVKMATKGTANALEGYVILDSGEKKGACYINNKYVAPLGQYFKINFIQ